LLGRRKVVYLPAADSTDGAADCCEVKAVFPGSFNPLHEGHVRMAAIAGRRLGEAVWLEISMANVDKPPLDFLTIRERLDRLTSYNVCLTRAPTFVEKAELFRAASFVVGADTLARIADEQYYHGERDERDAAIARLDQLDTKFLVFGRTRGDRFVTLADLSLPPQLAAMCEGVGEIEFRDDISSTELRTELSESDRS
jgi:hypothetical protein